MISGRSAANILLVALGALAGFHVLMLLGVLPPGIAWGGRAGSSAQSVVMLEVVGLIVTVIFAAIVIAKCGYFGIHRDHRAVSIATWVVFGYFVLNVAGNLASASAVERAVFTPVSVVLALLALRLAMER